MDEFQKAGSAGMDIFLCHVCHVRESWPRPNGKRPARIWAESVHCRPIWEHGHPLPTKMVLRVLRIRICVQPRSLWLNMKNYVYLVKILARYIHFKPFRKSFHYSGWILDWFLAEHVTLFFPRSGFGCPYPSIWSVSESSSEAQVLVVQETDCV